MLLTKPKFFVFVSGSRRMSYSYTDFDRRREKRFGPKTSRSYLSSKFSSLVQFPHNGDEPDDLNWLPTPSPYHYNQNSGNYALPRAKLIVPTHSYGRNPESDNHSRNLPHPKNQERRSRRHNVYSRFAQIVNPVQVSDTEHQENGW